MRNNVCPSSLILIYFNRRNGRCTMLYWINNTIVILLTTLTPESSDGRVFVIVV